MKWPSDFVDKIICGDCVEVMKEIPENSIDAIVTDPPYGLAFMGEEWDKLKIARKTNSQVITYLGAGMKLDRKVNLGMQLWHAQWLKEAYRILKPGASLLAMGGTRTFHRLMVAIEDVGFIIKDTLMWLYGSGFPKAQDLGKMIDKRMGVKRNLATKEVEIKDLFRNEKEKVIIRKPWNNSAHHFIPGENHKERVYLNITEPATDLAKYWDGWKIGGIKPAYEPIVWAVKSPEGSYVDNVLKWEVGAVNVDACRIETDWNNDPTKRGWQGRHSRNIGATNNFGIVGNKALNSQPHIKGRFPANVILDEEAGRLLDEQSGISKSSGGNIGVKRNKVYGKFGESVKGQSGFLDLGGASRFFYCAKASRAERGEDNKHPTVKPIKLFEWLIKLVTREGQIVLDPFLGSGTTAIAAYRSDRKYIGIEREKEYIESANARLAYWKRQPEQMKLI